MSSNETGLTPRPRRRWRRRFLWLLALVILARVALAFGAGPALKAIASGLGVELDFERFDLALLEGRVEIWRLEAAVAGEAGAEPTPLLEAHTLAFDLDTRALWGGALRVRRLELDGARIDLRRDAEGRWNFAALLPSGASEPEPRDEEEEPEPEAAPFDLRLPVEVVAARMQDVSIHLRDELGAEPVQVDLTLSVSATDLGAAGAPGRLDVVATSPQVLDLFRLRSAGTNEQEAASWRSEVELSGLRLGPLAPLLETLGIRPVAGRLDAGGVLELAARTRGEARGAVAAELDLSAVELLADGEEALGLDRLRLEVGELDGEGVAVSRLSLEAPRLRAQRLPSGAPALAGLAWVGPSPAPAAQGTPAPEETRTSPEAEPAPTTEPSTSSAFAWSLDEVSVTGGVVVFLDALYAAPVELEARLDDLRLGPLTSAAQAPPAQLELAASCPGVAEAIALRGPVDLSTPVPSIELALDVRGLAPERVAPYLAEVGIESTFESGRLHLDSLRFAGDDSGGVELALGGLGLREGEEELGAIDRIRLAFPASSPAQIEVGGSRLSVSRTAEGEVLALGLRFGGSPVVPERAAAPAEPPAEPAPVAAGEQTSFELPALHLPGAQLELTQVVLVDERRPEEPLQLGPMTVELAPAQPEADEARAYSLRVDGRSPIGRDIGGELRLGQASEGALSVSGAWQADGLQLEPLAPWLELAGVEPTLTAGAFAAELSLRVASSEGRPRIDLDLGPLHLEEDGEELLGLERLVVEDLRFGDELSVAGVRVDSPRIALRRDADGGWAALGLRLPPPAPESDAPREGSPPARAPQTEPTAEPTPAPGGAAPLLRLDRFELTAARARFDDLGLEAPHRVEVEGELSITDLAPGAGAAPTALEGGLRIADWALRTRGSLTLDPQDLHASLELAASGLDPEPVAPYLPPGLALTLEEGAAQADLELRFAEHEEGGNLLSLRLAGVELRDGERALAALEDLSAELRRFDLDALVLDVEAVTASGARAEVLRTAGGGVEAFGLRVEPRAAVAAQAAEGGDRKPRRSGPSISVTGTSPRMRVDRLELELEELRVAHEDFPDAEPVALGARLALREPYLFEPDLDAEAEEAPALGFDVEARIQPGIGDLDVDLELSPFEELPRADALVAVRGIDGAGLLALAPELAEWVDPGELHEGTFDARIATELSWRRRGPLDFDLSNGFGADVLLSEVALRQAEGAEVALGVDVLDARVRRVAPRSGLVHLTSLEIDTPRARLRRTAEGIEVAGLLLRLPLAEPAATPLEAAPEESALPAEQDPTVAIEAAAQEGPAPGGTVGELRIESLVVNGVDALFEDVSAQPPLVVPLDSLAVELRGFTTRALTEPIPLRLNAAVGAGLVDLPKRQPSQSLIGGITSGAKSLVGASRGEAVLEQRTILQEASISAHLAVVPHPEGWVRTSVTGFELQGLSGIAGESGVRIDDGVLDFNARLNLHGEAGGHVDSVTSFRYLAISEPDGGPISRFLSLPAPLGTVLFALENENGEHRIPLSFDFGEGGSVSSTTLASKASTALLKLITEALASAPMRTVDGVTSAIGLGGLLGGGDAKPEGAGLTGTIPFGAGTVRIDAAAIDDLEELIEAMEDDELLELRAVHVFGPGDFERAERLASPSSEEASTLLSSLRRRRDELLRQREELVASARAQLLLGQAEPYAATRQHLVEVSRDLGLAENGIDVVADLLRPAASKRRDRRTRDAALAIARARLETLSRRLLAAGVPYDRLDVRPPRVETLDGEAGAGGRIELLTRGGTPPKGFFRRIFGWIGL